MTRVEIVYSNEGRGNSFDGFGGWRSAASDIQRAIADLALRSHGQKITNVVVTPYGNKYVGYFAIVTLEDSRKEY